MQEHLGKGKAQQSLIELQKRLLLNEKDWISELDKSRVAKLTNSDAFDELFQLEKVLEVAGRLQLPKTSQELSGGGIIVDETSSDMSDDGN